MVGKNNKKMETEGLPEFTELSEFAGLSSGGKVLFATDDFFGPCENMLLDAEPIFIAEKYTEFGKWLDGWETRRKRIPGHDWAVLKLGTPCSIHGVMVDTAFFTGNFAPKYSIQAARLTEEEEALIPKRDSQMGTASSERDLQQMKKLNSDKWQEIVPKTALRPGYEETRRNYQNVSNKEPWTHLRVNMYPDGGIARLRVFGEAKPRLPHKDELVDLASMLNGASCQEYSNAHYGHPRNMIKASKSKSMADGWETARRLDRPDILTENEDGTLKVPGEEWAVFKLGFRGSIKQICVDTAHFKGNFPDTVKIEGADLPETCGNISETANWSTVLKRSKLSADKEHRYSCSSEPVTHIKVTMAPDGGISRIRALGLVSED